MEEGNTLVNALVGGVASVVLSFVPLSPLLGGALAGYLEGGSRNDGIRVGVYAGLVAAVPFLFFGVAFLLLWGSALIGMGPRPATSFLFVIVFVLFGLVAGALYAVGLSAAGGWLGNYVRYDTDLLD